jgi:phosphate-selective porin
MIINHTQMRSSRILFVALALFSLVSVAHLAGTVAWTGVNLAGGEFGAFKMAILNLL